MLPPYEFYLFFHYNVYIAIYTWYMFVIIICFFRQGQVYYKRIATIRFWNIFLDALIVKQREQQCYYVYNINLHVRKIKYCIKCNQYKKKSNELNNLSINIHIRIKNYLPYLTNCDQKETLLPIKFNKNAVKK